MAIRIKRQNIIFFLLLCSVSLFAQKSEMFPNHDFISKTYELSWIKRSPDKRYINFQKAYEYNSDTLAVVYIHNPERILFQTSNVYPGTVLYTRKGFLFMSGPQDAQLLKLPTLKTILWKNIRKAYYLESYDTIAVLNDNVLQFYTEDGVMIENQQNIVSLQYKENRLFFIRSVEDRFEFIEWTPAGEIPLYISEQENIVVDYCKGQDLIIHENDLEEGLNIIYLNIKQGKVSPLKEHIQIPINSIGTITSAGGGNYFLRVTSKIENAQKSTVDLWYGNDRNLEQKFRNNDVLQFILWNPLEHRVTPLNVVEFPQHINIKNKSYLLALDPTLHQDYTKKKPPYDMYRYDIKKNRYEKLGVCGNLNYVDHEGKYLLSYDHKKWVLFNIHTKERKEIYTDATDKAYFNSNASRIVFEGKDYLTEYDIEKSVYKKIQIPANYSSEIINGVSDPIGFEINVTCSYYDNTKPLLIKIKNSENLKESLAVFNKQSLRLLYRPSDENVVFAGSSSDKKNYLYVKSNFNKPPVLMLNANFKEEIIFRSNPKDSKAATYKMDKIFYKNSKGVLLTGLLYYPSHYDVSQKYPMIVGIYELMRNQSNRYLRDGFSGRVEGVNIRYYLDRGYFIYLPDIVYDDRGPGRSALDCVESSLDALGYISGIDFGKVGLIGHSHGGYETNFIATQSKRFAAYVSGAGNSDLVRSYHSFNYNFVTPFYWQFEEQQYRMFKPFAEAKNLYIDNSPIYHAEKVSSPILLWAGTKDENIAWDQSMEYYMGLRRNKKEVIALFYKEDRHSLRNRTNREDLFIRISEWFNFHLKEVRKKWIDDLYK